MKHSPHRFDEPESIIPSRAGRILRPRREERPCHDAKEAEQ